MNDNDRFPTTRWSCVLRASDTNSSGKEALEQLCKDYWYPLYAFARRRGLGPEGACDLVQGFLADFIERRDFSRANPDHGRFRSFLRTSCSNYLASAYAETGDFESAVKWQLTAIQLLQDKSRMEEYESNLKLYQQKMPYRYGQ